MTDSADFRHKVQAIVREEIRHLDKTSAAYTAAVERELVEAVSPFAYVRSVHCGPDGDGWILRIYHDHESTADVIDEVVGKIAQVERKFGCYLEPWILHVSEKSPGMPDGTRAVFERS